MTKRCFIAINLPQEARWELESLSAGLEKKNQNQLINFVKPKQIHVTLHFLGDLTKEQINQVKDILAEIAPKYDQTELITGGLGAFPDLKQPNVIFLETKEIGTNSLARLQKEIGERLEKLGLKIDKRKWTPHLTLARCKENCRFKADGVELSELSIPVKSVELMASRLNSEGPEYSIISSYKFNI
ncbi:MAG: 2'-5' RNA ligase [Candidatus Buchananbacteria bacterium RIFCSPLOWO2_02_FULL_46_11b]|uniref:RNA 2',3'-cyclic phosphodiesterase n=2 Tax=Candidatus Buchananiibacteriota TaxID=1817903 RepID=A0A1G1YV14_9BACT|nr:MAG: 2'-5' RNA ligase [Candidatus Buchananbacteria bacterium RIFCSPLOWO2_02_FULL_46_11b]